MNYTTAHLIEANARNRSLYLRGLGTYGGATTYAPGDVTYMDTGMGVLNLVVDVAFTPENADRRIGEVLAYYRERQASCAWNISPLCQPADLGDRLRAHGLHYEHDLVYMAAPLAADPGARHAETSGFRLQAVTEPDLWADLVCTAFDIPEPWRSRCLPVLKGAGGADGAAYRRYVGHANGQPVACGALLLADGVAGIYWVGTVPEVRGKGFGKAVMQGLLAEAREEGCHLAVLQATGDGLPLYQKLGFETLPAAEPSYLWFPEE